MSETSSMTRPLKLEDFPPSVQRRLRLEQGKRPVRATPKIRLPRTGYDSKLEEEWARHLDRMALPHGVGAVVWWRYHPLTLILPGGSRYTPDTLVRYRDPAQPLEFQEVKGYRRRGERTTLLLAAQMVRELFGARLVLVWKDWSGWQEQEITT